MNNKFSRIVKYLFTIGLVPLLAGCLASAPTKEDLLSADYGQPMKQSQCELLAVQVINSILIDPSSAQYSFTKCQKGGMSSVPVMGLEKEFGYIMDVIVNAKNRFGGYVGRKSYGFLFRDGVVVRKTKPDGIPYY